jgi:hypothetical protein
MSCADYWESQGVDPLNAMFTVGCRMANPDAVAVVNGADVWGGFVFFCLIITACCFAKAQGQL